MDTYKIDWKASAAKELKRLDRSVVPRVTEAVAHLAKDPFPSGYRKLKGSEHTYRIRVGDYRVVYEVTKGRRALQIIRIRHRKDVYH